MEEFRRGKVKVCKKQNQVNPYGNYTKEFFEEDKYQDMNKYLYEYNEIKNNDDNEIYKYQEQYIVEENNYPTTSCSCEQAKPYENSQLVAGCENTLPNNSCGCGCSCNNNTTQNNNCSCQNQSYSECKLASEDTSSCVQNSCQDTNSCCIPITVGPINPNNTTAYPVQINKISDSVSFTQYANYSVPTIEDWTVSVSCGTLPSTGAAYVFNVKEICLGNNELDIESQTITVNSRDITESGTTIYTGPSSSMVNYGVDNFDSCCCEKGLGAPLLYSRTNLSYQLTSGEEDTVDLTLRGNCGCVQIVATATVTVPITFTFSNVSGQICAPANALAAFIQKISQVQLGFACIEGATITETAGDDGAAPTYTVTVPNIEMILCLQEILNLVSIEQTAVLGLNQTIEPKPMPTAPQICNFVNCSIKNS